MLKRSILGVLFSFLILMAIFAIFIVDWRSPKDIISKSFMIPVAASDMRCAMYLNDEYRIADTQNYDSAPFLMSFLQPVLETDIFTSGNHDIEIVAWPLEDRRGVIEKSYCKMHLQGTVNNAEEYLFQDSVGARISFDENGEVIVEETNDGEVTIDIKRNEDGSIRYISVIQPFPIHY